jgi:hypothetical protein
LRYRLRSGPFTAANLRVTWNDPAGTAHDWHPGDVDRLNLGGLTYSLDNISKPNLPEGQMDLESPVNDMIPGIDVLLPEAKPGLLSRGGYARLNLLTACFIDVSSAGRAGRRGSKRARRRRIWERRATTRRKSSEEKDQWPCQSPVEVPYSKNQP